MKTVLVLDSNKDIRALLDIRISRAFYAQVVSKPLNQARSELSRAEFSMVICDVEGPKSEGLWLHHFLAENHPKTKMIFFISPEASTHIPQIDAKMRSVVLKFEFEKLIHEIGKMGVFYPRPLN